MREFAETYKNDPKPASVRLMESIRSDAAMEEDMPIGILPTADPSPYMTLHQPASDKKNELPLSPPEPLTYPNVFPSLNPMQRLLSHRLIGVQISQTAVRIVSILRFRKLAELQWAASIENITGWADSNALSEELRYIAKRKHIGHIPVVLILGDTDDLTFRTVRLNEVPESELFDVLIWKNKKEFHFFGDAPVVMDYYKLSQDNSNNAANMLIAGIRQDTVDRLCAIVQSAGLTIGSVIIGALAQDFNGPSLCTASQKNVVLDIGNKASTLTLYHHERILFVRVIPIGIQAFNEALMQTIFVNGQSYSLAPEEAAHLRKAAGLSPMDPQALSSIGIPLGEAAVMMRPAAEKMIKEIKASMDYCSDFFREDTELSYWITGYTQAIPDLDVWISTQLAIGIKTLSCSQTIVVSDTLTDDLNSYTGLCNAIRSTTAHDISPLPLRKTKTYRMWSRYLLAFSLLEMLIALLVYGIYFVASRGIEMQITALTSSMSLVTPQYSEYAALENANQTMEQTIYRATTEQKSDASAEFFLKLLSAYTPDDVLLDEVIWGGSYNITEVERQRTASSMRDKNMNALPSAEQRALKMRGEVSNQTMLGEVALQRFILALDKSGFFDRVELRETSRDTPQRIRFSLIGYPKVKP